MSLVTTQAILVILMLLQSTIASEDCAEDVATFFKSCSTGFASACSEIYLLQQKISALEEQIATLSTPTTSAPQPTISTTTGSSSTTISPYPSTTSTETTSTTTTSKPQYDMKYVVFNGMNAECNIAGNFGAACPIYSSEGVLEVIRTGAGFYKIYWDEAYPNNDYVVIATSNGQGTGNAYAGLGGNDDPLSAYFGISKNFTTINTREESTGDIDSDYIVAVAQPAFAVCFNVYI